MIGGGALHLLHLHPDKETRIQKGAVAHTHTPLRSINALLTHAHGLHYLLSSKCHMYSPSDNAGAMHPPHKWFFITSSHSPECTMSTLGWIGLSPLGTMWTSLCCHNTQVAARMMLWMENWARAAVKQLPSCTDLLIKVRRGWEEGNLRKPTLWL